jgi:hypothetical protein
MTITSNIPKPEGGFYKVGDTLDAEGAIAFAQAVGWKFCFYVQDIRLLLSEQGKPAFHKGAFTCMPYTIVGILPEHTATATTPNPPLTADEWLVWAQADESAWMVCPANKGPEASRFNWTPTTLSLSSVIAAMANGFLIYAYDPAEHPPTEREDS